MFNIIEPMNRHSQAGDEESSVNLRRQAMSIRAMKNMHLSPRKRVPNKIKGVCLLILFSVCFSFQFFFPSNVWAQKQRIRIAYPAFAASFVQGWVGADAGIFKKHGLDADIIYIGGGRGTSTLIGQSVDFTLGSDEAIYFAIIEGANLVRLGTSLNSLSFSLAVRPEIKEAKDLKGKVLGRNWGIDQSYASLLRALLALGMDFRADVKIIPVGAMNERLQAVLNGYIAGTIVFPPFDNRAESAGLRILYRDRAKTLNGGITTTGRFLSSNRELVKSFLKGYREAAQYAQRYKQEATAVLGKYLKTLDRNLLGRLYDDTVPYLEPSLYPLTESIQETLDVVSYTNPKAKKLKPTDFWDLSLLRELDREG